MRSLQFPLEELGREMPEHELAVNLSPVVEMESEHPDELYVL